MQYSVELFFNVEADAAVKKAWWGLAATAESEYMLHNGIGPHIALAITSEKPDLKRLTERLAKLAGSIEAENLKPAGIVCFTPESPVISIEFVKNAFLKKLHSQVLKVFAELGVANDPYYEGLRWRPHCTLARQFPPARRKQVMDVARTFEWKNPFRPARLALISYPPTIFLWSVNL